MIVTTLCPYVCFSSVVVPSTSVVELETLKPSVESLAIIDGRYEVPLEPDSVVQIWKSEQSARFIRFKSFYERFKRRLVFYKVRR
jgi:NAD kinase